VRRGGGSYQICIVEYDLTPITHVHVALLQNNGLGNSLPLLGASHVLRMLHVSLGASSNVSCSNVFTLLARTLYA
jgi:hypothetical protein